MFSCGQPKTLPFQAILDVNEGNFNFAFYQTLYAEIKLLIFKNLLFFY